MLAALSLFLLTEMATGQTYDPMRPPQPDAAGSAADGQVQPNPEFENLPDTPGVEETYYGCTACHSTAIIKQQSLLRRALGLSLGLDDQGAGHGRDG